MHLWRVKAIVAGGSSLAFDLLFGDCLVGQCAVQDLEPGGTACFVALWFSNDLLMWPLLELESNRGD